MPNTRTTPAVISKTIGVPLNKSIQKTKNGTLIVSGFFTSDAPDMHGDIITRTATENATEVYRQWGNIRRMHAPDPVGKVLGIGTADGLDWNEVKIEVIDPKAVFEVENGLLQALSIGALINYEDITFLDTGGMLISAYLLGEISLVDHPANYDSYLKNESSAQSAVNMLVKQYGLDYVSKGMLNILKENEMTDKLEEKDVTIEDEIIEEATLETEVEDVEAEDVETAKEIVEETEEDIAEETIEEEVTSIDETEIVEEDGGTEEVDLSIDATVEEDEPDRLESIEAQLGILTDLVKTLIEKDAEIVEESIDEEPIEEVQDVDTEDATETFEVEHKTVIPADELETETEEVVEKDASSVLSKALKARFNIN
jgi:hypothetical protein